MVKAVPWAPKPAIAKLPLAVRKDSKFNAYLSLSAC
jgi:hypothetical protein